MRKISSLKVSFLLLFSISLVLSGCKSELYTALDIVDTASSLLEDTQLATTSVETEKVLVVSVIDGDTVSYIKKNSNGNGEYDHSKVIKGRLLCLNAPENTSKKEMFGDVSTQYLKQLIEGKEILIERDKDIKDKYGRELVHVFYNDQNINRALIENGLARVAYLYDDYKYINEYLDAEQTAKDKGEHIWSIPNYVNDKTNGYNMSVIQ